MEEIWKDIPGFEGKYQASSLGRIRSTGWEQEVYSETKGYYKRFRKGCILKQAKRNEFCYYKAVSLYYNGKSTMYSVHTLVALAFPEICGEYEKGLEISHLDENPCNNNPANLRWVTHKENNNWGTRTEKAMKKIRKPVWQMAKDGSLIERFDSCYDVERKLGYMNQGISSACNGRYKYLHNYKWMKEEDINPFVLRLLKDVYLQNPLFAHPA